MVEVLAGIGRVEHESALRKQLPGCVHLPRELEPFLDRRLQTLPLELVARDTDLKAVVSSMAKVRSEQTGELSVDWKENEPGAVLPASLEMIPSDDPRKFGHQLGRSLRDIIEVADSPEPSQQGEAEELAPLGGRQAEGRREATKELGFLGPANAYASAFAEDAPFGDHPGLAYRSARPRFHVTPAQCATRPY